jgi:hypothetical protein
MKIGVEAICNDVHINISYFAAWFTFTYKNYPQTCTKYFETICYEYLLNYEHFPMEERG